MPEITVPSSYVEEPFVQGGGGTFPAGTWRGELEAARFDTFPDWASNPNNNGFANAEGEVLGLQLGSAQALEEGQDDPGNQKCFAPSNRQNWVIRDGELNVWQIDPSESDVPYWKMRRAHRGLVNLAAALGAVTRNGSGGYSVDLEAFIDGLRSGAYDGTEVAFVTIHKPYTTREDEERTEVIVTQFLQAV